MAFYIRKAVKVGPLRFNLSKSGIGVSAGIPGFRVGSGPRGNYVHMGRSGLYYRKSISGKTPSPRSQISQPPKPQSYQALSNPSIGEYTEIESVDVSEMVDISSKDLVDEINSKIRIRRFFPLAFIGSILFILIMLFNDVPGWIIFLSALLLIGLSFLAHNWDELRRSVVIMYDFDQDQERAFEKLHDAFDNMTDCQKVWHIPGSSDVLNRKYNAGASQAVKRNEIKPKKNTPSPIKTNVEVPVINAGKQSIAFFPNCVLVFDSGKAGSIDYANINVDISQSRFVESQGVPSDSEIVGQTWKYVNKIGGPDRRFKDNPQLPIALYEDIYFRSDSGLNELFEVSKVGIGGAFAAAIEGMRTSSENARTSKKDDLL